MSSKTETYYIVEWYTYYWQWDIDTALENPAKRIKTLEKAKELANRLWVRKNHICADVPPIITKVTQTTEVIEYED